MINGLGTGLLLLIFLSVASCGPNSDNMHYKEIQLTFDNDGHTIHNTQVFSPDDEWIVFDSRNQENQIPQTGFVRIVNLETKEIKTLYATENQTEFGPGVGAATFSTAANRVLFIHGLRNCNEENPYSFTRRTGVAIDIDRPFEPIFMDARDILPPYTAGAHRGGTHAHTWSGDGRLVSFTYNDEVLAGQAVIDSTVQDLRTVGVMFPAKVNVTDGLAIENNGGEMFSAVVAEVTENPLWGSDQINKAFDEGWIGTNGYINNDGQRVPYAIAFQGNVVDSAGKLKTELFVVDLPEDLSKAEAGLPLEGKGNGRMNVPANTVQRRITFTESGVVGPRHWLRSTPDGDLIAFLTEDDNKTIQLYGVSPNGGSIRQITFGPNGVQSPFNFSPDGLRIAYFADNTVFITDVATHETHAVSAKYSLGELTGAPVWANNGKSIAYNRYVDGYVQLFLISVAP